MNTLRNNFTLLSLLCYVVEWIVVVAVLALLFPGKSGFALLDAARLGTLVGLMLWAFANVGRFLWNMNTGWSWKLFVSTGALFVPISILLFDLNAKILVSRLYTGLKPIPYTFLQSVDTR